MRTRPAERAIAEQHRRTHQHRQGLLASWGASVPGEYRGRSIEDIDGGWGGHLPRDGRVAARRYLLANGTRYLLLQGPKGVGKSTMAVTLAATLVERLGQPALFRNSLLLMASFSFRPEGEDPLKEAGEAPILVLDDLGAGNEGTTPHQQRSLWALIESRWANPSLRTIITTNMAISSNREGVGLVDWLGPSAWDRVSDDLTRIVLTGESFRG